MGLTNPILDELQGLSPGAQQALLAAHGATAGAAAPLPAPGGAPAAPAPMQAPQNAPRIPTMGRAQDTGPAPEVSTAHTMGGPSAPPAGVLTAPAAPEVTALPAARGTLEGDKAERTRLMDTGSGISQISGKVQGAMPNHPLLGKILGGAAQGVATLGDALLAPAIPAVLNKLPGTEEHHNVLVKRADADVGEDEANAQKEAQTKNLDLQPQLKLAQQGLAQEKQNEVERYHQATQQTNHDKLVAALHEHGYAPDETDPAGQKLRPLRYEEMSPNQQAVADLKGAQEEQAEATAALRKAQNDPTSPAYRIAQQRVDVARQNAATAIGRLGLSTEEFGFNQEKFFNPQPTAAERGKGDLAQSALERVQEMRSIVAKHPEYFGPVAGRATNAQAWLGSSDPDAVTYQSAAQYLADHSAGVFGGRGQYIMQALHGLTDPKYTPEGLNAALDEAQRAAQGFAKAGTVHGKGATGAAAAGGGGGEAKQRLTDGGVSYDIPASQVADFKKDHPNAR